jgi:acyl carrier protein
MVSNERVDDTLVTLKQILIRTAELNVHVSSLSDATDPFDNCGLDSVTIIDFVLAVERHFGFTIVEDEFDTSILRDLSALATFLRIKALSHQSAVDSDKTQALL